MIYRPAVILACLAMTAGACQDEPAPRDAAQATWRSVQTGVAAGTAAGRRQACYALHRNLQQARAARAGATADLPDCSWLRRDPLLDGSVRLGDLQDLKVSPRRAEAGFQTAGKPHTVAIERVNPGNWEIVELK